MDLDKLQSTITFLEEHIKSSTGSTKTEYEASLVEAQAALKKTLTNINTAKAPSATTTSEYRRNVNIKSIESALSESTFVGLDINETTRFIERLDKIYEITVKGVDLNLEADFVKLVKLRLSDTVFKNMQNSKADVSTFQNLKTWIKSTYGGNFNAFQLLQKAWDIEFKPTEKFSVYAQKVSEELRTALVSIQKQYKDINNASENLTIEALMEFIAGLLVSNNLRSYCFPLFKDMVNDMDRMQTAAEISNKAEFYRQRLGGNYIGNPTEAYWTNKQHSSNPQKPNSLSKQLNNYTHAKRPDWTYSKNGYPIKCHKCGELGHYANKCQVEQAKPQGKKNTDHKQATNRQQSGSKLAPNNPAKPKIHLTTTAGEPGIKESVFSPASPFQ